MLKDFLEGKPLRHPLHPMLVHFPIGLFILSFLLDLASLAFPSIPSLVRDSFYAMLLGIVTALIAAVPGLIDYFSNRCTILKLNLNRNSDYRAYRRLRSFINIKYSRFL